MKWKIFLFNFIFEVCLKLSLVLEVDIIWHSLSIGICGDVKVEITVSFGFRKLLKVPFCTDRNGNISFAPLHSSFISWGVVL